MTVFAGRTRGGSSPQPIWCSFMASMVFILVIGLGYSTVQSFKEAVSAWEYIFPAVFALMEIPTIFLTVAFSLNAIKDWRTRHDAQD